MNSSPESSSGIGRIVDEFADRHNRGDAPRVEEYLERYPAFAADLGEILPLLAALGSNTPSQPAAGSTVANGSGAAAYALPRVPGFALMHELGRGGMGVVYLARQEKLNRLVAFKTILSGAHAGDEARQRFLAEAEAVAKLQHSGIVQVYEFGTQNGQPYFALEYLSGGGLNERLQAGPLAARTAALLIEQLARAVAAAHAAGIVHRDLKPANVLFAADGTPKVTDFGLAKTAAGDSNLTATGAIMGTPSYMAPEQAGEAKDAGPLADVYALGAILYECLTGRPPFKGATVFDTIDLLRSQEPVSVRHLQPSVPRDLETICLKCLQKDPAKRYASASDLADDLKRFADGHPVVARPVGAISRGWRWSRRNPVVAGLLAGIAAILVAVSSGSLVAAAQFRASQKRAETAETGERDKRIESDENWKRAVAAEDDAGKKRLLAEAAGQDAERRLMASLLDQTRAIRIAREQGQRFGGLERIAEAARIARKDNDDEQIDRLRDEAVACLGLPDWKAAERKLDAPHYEAMAFDPDLAAYVRSEAALTLTVRSTADDKALATVLWADEKPTRLQLSAGGRRLLAGSGKHLMVWDLPSGARLYNHDETVPLTSGHALHPSGDRIAVAQANKTVAVIDLATGAVPWEIKTKSTPSLSAFSPDGRYLAVCSGTENTLSNFHQVQIIDLASRAQAAEWRVTGVVERFVWHPASSLALVGIRGSILLTKTVTQHRAELWRPLTGTLVRALPEYEGKLEGAAFLSEANQFVTATAISTVIWDGATLRPLFKTDGLANPTATAEKLGGALPNATGYRLGDLPHRVHMHTQDALPTSNPSIVPVSSPDGRWIALPSSERPAVIAADGRSVGRTKEADGVPVLPAMRGAVGGAPFRSAVWHPTRPELIVASPERLVVWTYAIEEAKLRFVRPKVVPLAWNPKSPMSYNLAWYDDFSKLGVFHKRAIFSVSAEWEKAGRNRTRPSTTIANCLTATGKLVEIYPETNSIPFLQASQTPNRLRVVDSEGRVAEKRVPIAPDVVSAIPSPNGRWVAVVVGQKISVFEVEHLDRPAYEIDREGGAGAPCTIAFHPDSQTLAIWKGLGVIELHDVSRRIRLVAMTSPSVESAASMLFTADGERLMIFERSCTRSWTLRSVRAELAKLGLDWNAPPMPPAAPPGPAVTEIVFEGELPPIVNPLLKPIAPLRKLELAPAPRRLP